ncbi:MAG: hypothetical protein J6386_13510 [Candidatus Synoicihabitans palmerolidicus]|nr:hypothetical protein [Candidatus Synoicihabitans palmerolidicus]
MRLTPTKDAPPGAPSRNVKITARQDPASSEWRLAVPPAAIDRFASRLGL